MSFFEGFISSLDRGDVGTCIAVVSPGLVQQQIQFDFK